ncbi:MAG: SDR family oxidoreductase [Fulvivirga sp.]|uniref:SDR family oxidoreductase n=1 Tax=Fulvivirga sp. TaxID=1931237 RepID=UPI0032EDADF7
MKKIIIAGATGYLGSHLVQELQGQNISFQAIARNEKKLLQLGLGSKQIIKAEVTDPTTLNGQFQGADVLISTVGITRQKDGLTYMDVDYQANMNLLNEAMKAGIKKFIYVSVINGENMRHLKIMEAKEKFVDKLKQSGMDYLVVRPNGFFSDMKDFLDMARKGKVYLFGNGEYKLNPIHGTDLAKAIIESLDVKNELILGGPDILTQNEIAEIALEACEMPSGIVHLPDWIRKMTIGLMRIFTSSRTYGPIEFFLTMMAQDNIAPRYGIHRLKPYFVREADLLKED